MKRRQAVTAPFFVDTGAIHNCQLHEKILVRARFSEIGFRFFIDRLYSQPLAAFFCLLHFLRDPNIINHIKRIRRSGMPNRPALKAIAQMAGLSHRAVSKALQGVSGISAAKARAGKIAGKAGRAFSLCFHEMRKRIPRG